MRKKRPAGIIVILVVLLLFGGLFSLWMRGGSELSSHYTDINTGKPSLAAPRLLYRGIPFEAAGEKLVLLKRYYAISEIDSHHGMTITVLYKEDGYNPFFIFYEGGGVAAQGLCMVETQEASGQILHDIFDVKQATYYAPDGTEVSSVKEGSGTVTLFFKDGSQSAVLQLENYQRKSLKIWSKDGTLKQEEAY